MVPSWANAPSVRTIRFAPDTTKSDRLNGQRLVSRVASLEAGDRLIVSAGRYELQSKWVLSLQGTAARPIRIEAEDPDDPPVLRRDSRQNLLNLGEGRPCRYLMIRGFEFVGGSVGIRMHDVAHFWLDRCHLHDSAHGGLTANSVDTHHLYLTGNHLHGFHEGTAEGMYLGGNHGKVVMRDSVIARNHVHDCRGNQGDGIEIKQGSYRNWVVENEVHDTKYPCILVYGTGGNGINVIERNTCYRSGDHVMQVQGEAIVRNNLLMSGRGAGFSSTDHQGKTLNLRFVHNTIITERVGANLSSWGQRTGMVFANNAVFTRSGTPVRFPSGRRGVTVAGNVVWPGPASEGFRVGRDLQDFADVSWDAKKRQARPSHNSSLLGAASSKFRSPTDRSGRNRVDDLTAGAESNSKVER